MLRTVAIANYFIDRSLEPPGRALYASSLTALLYFAHGWWLGANNQPLLDARFVAGTDGPEIPRLNRMLRMFDTNPVNKRLTLFLDAAAGNGKSAWTTPALEGADPAAPVLDQVWKALGGESVYLLHDLLTQPYTPWAAIWHGSSSSRKPNEVVEVDDERIRRWFVARREGGTSPLDAVLAAIKNKPLSRAGGDLV
ncbi:MAG: hypothetical protein P4L83_17055 [Nevskia sp.]|nr:hypothetical protein [Nevskia sp.]